MPFPRAAQTIELLREEAIDIARPILSDAVDDIRDQLCDIGAFTAVEFRAALDAFAATLRKRWNWEFAADPTLRQKLGEVLDAMVAAAARPDRTVTTLH